VVLNALGVRQAKNAERIREDILVVVGAMIAIMIENKRSRDILCFFLHIRLNQENNVKNI